MNLAGLVKDPTFVTAVVLVAVDDVAVIRSILFPSLRRKGFESPLACPARGVRPTRSAKCTPKSQKSIFCRRHPRFISRPISHTCNAAYFYPWPTSLRRSAALLFGHSRNRTRKKKREMRERLEKMKPCSFLTLLDIAPREIAPINYFLRGIYRNSALGVSCFLYKTGFIAVIKAHDRFLRAKLPKMNEYAVWGRVSSSDGSLSGAMV